MNRHRLVLSLCGATLTACASHPPQSTGGAACPLVEGSSTDVYEQTLPKMNFRSLGKDDYYPAQGKREHLEGRVLARFHLDRDGTPASLEFLQVEAPPLIANAACKLLHRVKFDAGRSAADTSGGGPFLVTVRYCLDNCNRVPLYPGSTDIAITASAIR